MTTSPAAARMISSAAASRIHAADASLYGFSPEASDFARRFMGWSTLASNPPCNLDLIQRTAEGFIQQGFTAAILIGQGGSTQAPMTMAEYVGRSCGALSLHVLDSLAPASVRDTLSQLDLAKTLLLVSSKSGTTLEVLTMLQVLRAEFARVVPEQDMPAHLVAITDPGTKLEQMAKDEGWAAVLPGEPTVGGRFSALSVFGLFPAALMGANLSELVAACAEVEQACAQDLPENPALGLAAFIYDEYQRGRDCLTFLSTGRMRTFGLWLEQLVAESLGKNGQGIVPNLENDPTLLSGSCDTRSAVVYRSSADEQADQDRFEKDLLLVDASIPRRDYSVGSLADLMGQFVIWEYAIALCGWLMGICPFDQPDVQSAKTAVLRYLEEGLPASCIEASLPGACAERSVQLRISECVAEAMGEDAEQPSLAAVLKTLLNQVRSHDCLSVNAFLPTTDPQVHQVLESIRVQLVRACNVPVCLEMGPRYLHSVGQLQKGGPDNAIILLISAEEPHDIALDSRAKSLGNLEKTQAVGDFMTLSERGRRCVHVHLPNASQATLQALADEIARAADI